MKARFYRGPWDGKIRNLLDDQEYLVVEKIKVGSPLYNSMRSDLFPVPIDTTRSIYRRTRHTHPDGSVFFEWDKPKGSKI